MRSCHVAMCGRKISDGVKLFPLPQNSVRRQLWLDKIKRREANRHTKIKNIRICSKHFYGGKPAKEIYPRHPDFVPSLLLGNEPLKLIESTHLYVIQDHSLPVYELDQHNIPSNCEESLHTTMEYEVPSDENPSETTLHQDSLCHESPSQSALLQGNEIDCIPIPAVECFTTSQVSNSTTNLDDNLEGELQRLRLIEQVSQLTKQVELLQFKLDCKSVIKKIEKDDDVCQYYTGINSHEKLWMIYQWVVKFLPLEDRRVKLNYFEQFVLTLMKLKLNLGLQDLAYRFEISLSTASKYFSFWIHSLYTCLVPALISWPKRENLRTTLPLCFRDKFDKCNCIIDCFEIFIDRPIQIKERASTYSNYKSHNTAKYLIGIAPQGYISFISRGYGGRSSNKFIVQESGFLENLEFGDLVLADRGFSIHEAVGLQNAELKIPSFLGKKKQLTSIEVEESRDLARVRVHVERVIGAVSQRYSILQGPLNYQCLLTDFSTEYVDLTESVVDKMVAVACALYNSCPSVVPLA